MQLWTSVEALTLFQEIHVLQIPPYPQVGYACSEVLFCQLSPLQMGAILDFLSVGDRQGVHFAKFVYIKGMLFHISLM